MTVTNEAVYSSVKKESAADRAAYKARLRIYARLSEKVDLRAVTSVIDVGVTADRENI